MNDATTGADRPTAGLRAALEPCARSWWKSGWEEAEAGDDWVPGAAPAKIRDAWSTRRGAEEAVVAALAALDARLARLTRFVRAHDARESAFLEPTDAAYDAARLELRAARDAIRQEDLP